jgi:tRNA/rRNA methyltransferase
MTTRFILINTSHAGNVGAAARALKVMGFDDLVLVAPRWANVLRREETIQRSSGALDVLAKARIVDTLDEALDGITHLCATAMTPRDFGPPTFAPRAYFEQLMQSKMLSKAELPTLDFIDQNTDLSYKSMGFLFGSERFGMSNEDVYRCHACLQIPTNPQFGSLNLASAVQLIAYEWRMALGGFATQDHAKPGAGSGRTGDEPHTSAHTDNLADARAVAGMLAHLQQALEHMGYLDPAAPKKLMPRLNGLFNRANLRDEEIHILRGIAKAMLKATPHNAENPTRVNSAKNHSSPTSS